MKYGTFCRLCWLCGIICFLGGGVFFYLSARGEHEEREEITSGKLTLTSEEQAFLEETPFRRVGEGSFYSVCLFSFDPKRRPCLVLELLERYPEIQTVTPLFGNYSESIHTYVFKMKPLPPESP